ncbi:hypothetical protein ADUPG1_011848 [Aduncisulcus paluster]|uniref:UBC core domain-containing protein n=1 Tax=Aduncisulcus paluster TaxID=2918883 RepID=A0ABQ5K0N4_9EUKA|nr:hypothetical protein ADUPG1_011848 [Aduncisulcus paluster]
MSLAAVRVQTELRRIARRPDENIIIKTSSGDLKCFKAWIKGAKDTVYEGGQWELEILVPSDYPHVALKVKFLTKIFHPNINYKTGEICLDILKEKDAWTPAWGIASVCRAILLLLDHPDATSPLNCDAGNMVRAGDIRAYRTMASICQLQ